MKDVLIRTSAVMIALLFVAAFSSVALAIYPYCGDGYVQTENGETCDPPYEPAPNGNMCREDCTYCGDGIQDEGEECDDGNTINDDDCDNNCMVVVWPECGDGYVDSSLGETCDPPYEPAPNGNMCREDCTYCGDGYVDAGEECDDGDTDDMDECSNDCTVPPGYEGCTPGYWKNKTFAWEMTAYTTDMMVSDVFTLPGMFSSLGDTSLRDALKWSSGDLPVDKAANLIKHAIAALLNASHPDVDYSWMTADIIAAVNAALDEGDPDNMDALHMQFDDANNAGCPLSGRAPREDRADKNTHRKQLNSRIKNGDVSGSAESVRF